MEVFFFKLNRLKDIYLLRFLWAGLLVLRASKATANPAGGAATTTLWTDTTRRNSLWNSRMHLPWSLEITAASRLVRNYNMNYTHPMTVKKGEGMGHHTRKDILHTFQMNFFAMSFLNNFPWDVSKTLQHALNALRNYLRLFVQLFTYEIFFFLYFCYLVLFFKNVK